MNNHPVDGLILNLFKRKLTDNSSSEPFDMLLFGFYDGMVMTHPESWEEFNPQGIDEQLNQKTISKSNKINGTESTNVWRDFSSIYPIKMLFPRVNCRKSMERAFNFDFSFWEKSNWESPIQNKSIPPLFAAMLLNVTRSFALESQDHRSETQQRLSFVADTIYRAIQTMESAVQEDLKKTHCGLFQCVGYYDYVLLFATDNWKPIFQLDETLKKAQTNNNNLFLSNSYLLLGMNPNKDAWNEIDENAECKLTIRLNLKPGFTTEQVQAVFLNHLKIRENNTESVQFWEKAEWFQSVGSSDCVIQTKPDLKQRDNQHSIKLGMKYAMREFLPQGLFCLKGNYSMLPNPILQIRTTVRRTISSSSLLSGQDLNTNNLPIEKDNKTINDIFSWMDNTIEKFDSAPFIRRCRALEQILKQYQNLISNNHAFDIQCMLDPVYKMMYTNLQGMTDEYNTTADSEKIYVQENIFNYLTDFREMVGSFQDALQLSDRYFIESATIRHPSVGSSTKLLIAYNEIINRYARQIQEGLLSSNEYCFLFTCGGCDYAQAINLSGNISIIHDSSDFQIGEHRLIIMQLAERRIFDIQGTLFRSMHEMWHFCGDRQRTERIEGIIRSAAYKFADCISAVLLQKNEYVGRLGYCATTQELDAKLSRSRNEMIAVLSEQIIEYLQNEYQKNKSSCADFDYQHHAESWLTRRTKEFFMKKSSSGFWRTICEQWREKRVNIYRSLIGNQSVNQIRLKNYLWLDEYDLENNIIQFDSKLIVQSILDFLAGAINKNTMKSLLQDQLRDWNNNEPDDQIYDFLLSASVSAVYEDLFLVYRETLSDFMACCSLGVNDPLEYLSNFTTDECDWICKFDFMMRIGSILEYRCGFSIDDDLDLSELDQEMQEKINKIWRSYQEERRYGSPYYDELVKYLKIVWQKNRSVVEQSSEPSEYASNMWLRHLYNCAKQDTEDHDGTMDIIKEIMNIWAETAQSTQYKGD